MYYNPLTTIDDINNVVSSNSNTLVIIRIGDISDPLTVSFDELLFRIKNKISKFVKIYFCENIPEVVKGLGLSSSCLLIFYNNHLLEFNIENEIQNYIDFLFEDEEMIEILEECYEVGRKGKKIVKINIK
ncbi:Thioredoxin-like protein 4A [Nosema bombycis CQ1]|uniref:Thioredoxin-like protein 4A n=1 Tax=Nosema bombycis (strain CQ1 / CVCC 102059) TaxID=578461 RepID=R0KR92_NOSB1|nr:Thioredoxin-like protein 4A [Nosema bombycis CQ1]|eukprot:EOB13261.1 Thioredoxin-like protein 4A [Nosema bombycis CQ1]